jgi:8-oxo-dGTP diphosphatase
MGNAAVKYQSGRVVLSSDPMRPLALIPYTLIACLNQHRELFMVKRSKPPFIGCWNFIGGKIDAGETPASAAIRELHEEARRHATQKSFSFRGIALWPDPSDTGRYLGMFMFRFYTRTGKAQSRQLGLLHEGVTAWVNLDLLFHSSEFKPVPNFGLIAPHILDTRVPPVLLCHEIDNDVGRLLWSQEIRTKDYPIVSRPYGSPQFSVADLIAAT